MLNLPVHGPTRPPTRSSVLQAPSVCREPLDSAAGVSSEPSVAWDGHAPGGRPQLTRKSEFGVFDTSVRSVPSGRTRYMWAAPTWATPADSGRASEKTIHRPSGDHAGPLEIPAQ